MQKFINKFPWGVAAGVTGILCFYFMAASFGIQFVFAQVNAQTGQVATLFDTWWQTLLFVFAMITAILFVASLVMFILRKASVFNKGGAK